MKHINTLRTILNRVKSLLTENRDLYISLVENDFKSRYNGSAFGVIWGMIQPLVTILIYWFVFQFGLRAGSRPDGIPYILWLICGMLPWFFFSEALSAVTGAFVEYSYLVKKVHFQMSIIPEIKIGSSLVIHMIFIVIGTVVLNFYGIQANWYYFQLIYYIVASIYLLAGTGLILSSLNVFFRDMSQIVGILIQIGFWVIPIVWGSEILTPPLLLFFKLNPVFYIVEGYRETLLNGIPFWSHPTQTFYFWSISTVLLLIGAKIFQKLKPSFADVL